MKKKKNMPKQTGEQHVEPAAPEIQPAPAHAASVPQSASAEPAKNDVPESSPVETSAGNEPSGWNMVKRYLKDFRILTALCAAAVVALTLWIGIAVWLPSAAERAITDAVSVISGVEHVELNVVAVYPRTARLSCVLRDGTGRIVMSCNDVRLRYSPWSIRSGKIRRIVFKNAVFDAEQDVSSLIRHWLEIRKAIPGNLSVGRIVFEDAELAAGPYGRTVFSATFEPGIQSGWERPHFETHTPDRVEGAFAWKLNGDYQLKERALSLFGKAQFPAAVLPAVQKLNFSNLPFSEMLTNARQDGIASVSFRSLTVQYPAADAVSAIRSLELDFSFHSPALDLTDGYAAYDNKEHRFIYGNAAVSFEKNSPRSLDFELFPKDGIWTVSMKTPADSAWRDHPWKWTANGRGSCNDPVLNATLDLSASAVAGSMDCGGSKLKWSDSRVSVSADEWKSGITLLQNGQNVRTQLNGLNYLSPFFQLSAQTLSFAPSSVSVESGRLEFPEWKLILDGISGGSADASKTAQRFSVSSLRIGKMVIGSMNGQWERKPAENGSVLNVMSKVSLFGMQGSLQGTWPLSWRKADQKPSFILNVPAQPVTDGGRGILSLFLPRFDTVVFSGNLALTMKREASGENPMRCVADHGVFSIPSIPLTLSGVNFVLEKRDSLSEETLPGLPFSFDALTLGTLHFGAGNGTYRIDAEDVLHLESATAEWCGGKVRFSIAELQPGKMTVSLDCTWLDFAQFLTQAGLGKFAGTGLVSGHIPVTLTAQGIEFKDGYLYSVPGEDGTLKGTLQETVLSGKAMTNDHLSFACEMIRDMSYRWVKIRLNSTKDGNLRLSLRFNGSPRRELSYEPDIARGGIRKSARPTRLGYLLLNLDEINLKASALKNLAKMLFPAESAENPEKNK